MKRADLVTVALQGDQGKPRPALIVQSDHFADLAAVTVLPITSTLLDAPLLRPAIEPTDGTGLSKPSQIMVDKPQTVHRGKIGGVIGRLDAASLRMVDRALVLFLGLA